MMAKVVRMTNPEAFSVEEIRELFTQAFEKNPMTTFEKAVADMTLAAGDPNIGMFIGVEGGEFLGLSIVCLPHNKLVPMPSVYHFANFGSDALRALLVDETVDFCIKNGYTRFWAINVTGKSDKAYGSLFEKAGKSKRIGSFLEFQIG
jgi:hypothetical protein